MVGVPAHQLISRNPADPGDEVLRLTPAGGIELDRMIGAATEAAPGWARTPAPERGERLREAAERMAARAGELASLVCREVGKPIAESRGEVARAVSTLRYYAGLAYEPEGDSLPALDGRSLLITRRAPRGVVGMITPWNFPLAIPVWKLAPALASGNACVLKPSEHSPACAEELREIFAGLLPEGVLSIVHGEGDVGGALVSHPGIRALSFTGSTRVGQAVAVELASRGLPAQCEMGGQNASLVLDDADVERAAAMIAAAAMGYAGQKCTATSRVICEQPVYESMRDALTAVVDTLVVEDPSDERCQVGPLIEEPPRDRAIAAIARARDAGGRLLRGGGIVGTTGWYLQPTVFELDDPAAELAQEEVFAPVCAMLRAADATEAAQLAAGV